ncbi:MAG: DUF1805 domain-containing protein [archaeon]
MKILIEGGEFEGVKIDTENTAVLVIKALHGMLGCGYINVEAADKFGDAVAIVTGVKSFEDMLEAKVVKVSEAAQNKGVEEGMTGKEALILLNTVKKD